MAFFVSFCFFLAFNQLWRKFSKFRLVEKELEELVGDMDVEDLEQKFQNMSPEEFATLEARIEQILERENLMSHSDQTQINNNSKLGSKHEELISDEEFVPDNSKKVDDGPPIRMGNLGDLNRPMASDTEASSSQKPSGFFGWTTSQPPMALIGYAWAIMAIGGLAGWGLSKVFISDETGHHLPQHAQTTTTVTTVPVAKRS
jgi:hypothetical protein